jgi:hypothetical protein
MSDIDKAPRVDAKSFQHDLARLAGTLVHVVFREGVSHVGWPQCVSEDISMMLRYSLSVYNLLFYLNADIRRRDDTEWRVQYGVSAMSTVRSLIDCLYNITAILENPTQAGYAYRKSGLNRMLNDLDEDHQAYLGQPKWEEWYIDQRKKVHPPGMETIFGIVSWSLRSICWNPWPFARWVVLHGGLYF